ncbi:MAG TPA: hemerythrin domain-containing protein [Planctomycetota bacterium]|nr:hemerythrin domain-containing protein [Planctomycetota bacterium]
MPCHAASATSPTDVLRAEHRVIERALDVLDRLASQGAAAGALDVEACRGLVEFFRTFADACHHGKEEDLLFPALERRVPGFGPAVVMRHEHDEGRVAVAGLHRAVEARDVAAFAGHARTYGTLLRAHIQKEDHCLWPLADGLLDAAAKAELLAAFERAEIEHVGPGVHERMLEQLDALAARCGLSTRPGLRLAGGGGCGCRGAAADHAADAKPAVG